MGSVRATEPGADHDDLVGELVGVSAARLDQRDATTVLDPYDASGEDLALLQHRAERHHDMPRLDAAGGRLRKERLVGHVRPGVHDDDLDLA
jgi:hypothetical protein